jgi:hypothetical protein
MAPRDLMNSTAMDTVFGNLGMDSQDLGMTDDDFVNDLGGDDDVGGDDLQADGLEGDDHDFEDGQDDDPFAIDDGQDDGQQRRVTHTPDRRQQQQRAQPQRQAQDQQGARKFRPDAKGNIVNGKGEIVARAGKEARIFMSGEKHRKTAERSQVQLRETAGRLNRVTQIAERLYNEMNTYKAERQAFEKLGMKAEDQVSAMQLYTQLTKNPKETLTKLLTRAAANGITLDANNSNANNNQLPAGIADIVKEVLGEKLKPIETFVTTQQAREAAQQRAREDRVAVQSEVEGWFAQNPAARPHAEVFQRVLRNPQFSNMSLGEIWARIQLNQARNPRRGNGLRDNLNGGRRSTSRHRGSPPNGRGMPPQGTSEMADVNASWDSIVRDVLDANGVV